MERDVRSAEETLRGQRGLLAAERGEAEKLQREVQQQTRASSELPAQRRALQRDVDAARGETTMLNAVTVSEQAEHR